MTVRVAMSCTPDTEFVAGRIPEVEPSATRHLDVVDLFVHDVMFAPSAAAVAAKSVEVIDGSRKEPCAFARPLVSCNQMVARQELSDAEIDRIFRAMADATRRDILQRTLVSDASITELAAAYDMSFAAVQKHVGVLETAGLVTKKARGRQRIVRADPVTISRARELLDAYEQIWRDRIGRIDQLLAEEP